MTADEGRVKLTKAQRDLLNDLVPRAGAANVRSIVDARAYREMEREGLVRICKPVGRFKGTEAIPYFAVRLKAAGLSALEDQS